MTMGKLWVPWPKQYCRGIVSDMFTSVENLPFKKKLFLRQKVCGNLIQYKIGWNNGLAVGLLGNHMYCRYILVQPCL